jgi:hypothetical protein
VPSGFKGRHAVDSLVMDLKQAAALRAVNRTDGEKVKTLAPFKEI